MQLARVLALMIVIGALVGCGPRRTGHPPVAPPRSNIPHGPSDDPLLIKVAEDPEPVPEPTCGGEALRVAFYDVEQGLSALVTLPDGRRVLVDTGESAKRPGCGAVCTDAHAHLMQELRDDLGDDAIDLLWITHPHSDHIGGATDIIDAFDVKHYVDNGRDLKEKQIASVRKLLKERAVDVNVVEPGDVVVPLESTAEVKLSAIAPSEWLPVCDSNRNLCSIMLRIDYCASSVLFVGDAETEEEELVDIGGPVTLLQVGHHGSNTSTSAPFLAMAQPKYAVISSGTKDAGTNRTYCHPRKVTVDALTEVLGGPGSGTILSFDPGHSDTKCKEAKSKNWSEVPSSDHLWSTARDGDVVLTTTGDGTFERVEP